MPQVIPKRITFKPNPAGIIHIDVDMQSWIITNTCAQAMFCYKRAFKLIKHGQRVAYRNGSEYVEINADIERIG